WGCPPVGLDLVGAFNVSPLPRTLRQSLAEAKAALAPGGGIVIGEGLPPVSRAPVPAEFPFRLLRAWHDVTLDPLLRPAPGFLTAEQWVAQLRLAGFADVATLPTTLPLRPL